MKNLSIGLLLSFQFFSSMPIRKQLPMNNKTVTAMFQTIPIVSVLMGLTIAFLFYINEQFFQFSPLLIAILIVVANIVMTGGLHLDGWIDLSDAYFSYQDQQRRLDILSDSRVGAFGAIGLVVMILLKVAFIYEAISSDVNHLVYFFIAIPVMCRIAMVLYLLSTDCVKQSGLAYYFKSQVRINHLWMAISLYALLIVVGAFYLENMTFIILFVSMLVFVFIYRKWTMKNFGGMTGDLIGALYEGTELLLWAMLLLFI